MAKGVSKLRQALEKTRKSFSSKLKNIFSLGRKIDVESLDELEEALITADVGVDAASRIIEDLQEAYKEKKISNSSQLVDYLKADLKEAFGKCDRSPNVSPSPPTVIMVVGVNGTGKTTSISKLAQLYRDEDKKVILAASDTFRAAAEEQLSIWAERLGVDIIKHQSGADPAAVAFDAADAALARKADVLIVDTAGRLHTKGNLMKELEKIGRVLGKRIPGAPHEVLLVLDATTGQNAIVQAELFHKSVGVTGIILSKLDGTAKGGVLLAIRRRIDIPIKYIGLGEKSEDMEIFDPNQFVEALFE